MQNYFVMSGNRVAGIAAADPDYAAGKGWLAAVAGVGEGWVRVGEEWQAPPHVPAVVPASVTRRQGRLALLQAGKLDMAEGAIASIADPAQKRAAQIEYEADTWERNNAFLVALWLGMGGALPELDALFVTAETL